MSQTLPHRKGLSVVFNLRQQLVYIDIVRKRRAMRLLGVMTSEGRHKWRCWSRSGVRCRVLANNSGTLGPPQISDRSHV